MVIRWIVNSPAASVRPDVKKKLNKMTTIRKKVLKTSKTDLNTSWKVALHIKKHNILA